SSIATSSVRLQWGRDRSVAEIPPAGDPCPRTVCASMGPRPIGRGNALVPCLLGPSGAGLQWGRDRSVAEIRKVQALRLRLDGLLQWGRDRSVAEMPLDFADVYHWLAASMGPRPIGRGNLRVRHSGPLAGGRFNGAATDRSRKSAPPTPPLATPNPASVGPRPIGRGNYFRPPAPGGGTPGFNGAATDRSRKFARARRAEQGRDASMGPRPIGRGNEPRCPTSSNGPPGFNGAATDRSRKCERLAPTARRTAWLQWGRDRSVAEIPARPPGTPAPSTLQWGRDRSVAEIRPSGQGEAYRWRSFNGAATDRSRKSFRCCAVVGLRGASMGPRPIGRGNAGPRRSPGAGSPRFNGAATDRSRKCANTARARRRPAVASMGPRPIGRGNHSEARRAAARGLASMGPRPIGRGNVRIPRGRGGAPPWLQWGRDRSVAEIIPKLDGRLRADLLQWG